jgi:hypothetical protein
MNLDREMAYTDWRSSCRAPHPDEEGRVCRRAPHTGDHASGFGSSRMFWPNTDQPRPDFPVVPIATRSTP